MSENRYKIVWKFEKPIYLFTFFFKGDREGDRAESFTFHKKQMLAYVIKQYL